LEPIKPAPPVTNTFILVDIFYAKGWSVPWRTNNWID